VIAGTGRMSSPTQLFLPANADIPAPDVFPLPESPPGDAVPIVSRTKERNLKNHSFFPVGVIWESEDTGDIVSLRIGGIMRDAK